MASIAFDGPSANPASKQPISAHPAFPAIVALWFAALLGLGSMVLPAVLLERFVVATGIASLAPAASPPLGATAHAAIAAAAAIAGALIGLAIARRVARAQEGEPAPRFASIREAAPRPISVHEELGGEGLLNGRGAPITRRRALAIAEDERPSDFLYTAPLPGEDPHDPDPAPHAAEDDTLELCDAVPEDMAPRVEAAETPFEDREMTGRQEFQPIPPREADDEPNFEAAAEVAKDEQPRGAPAPEPLPFAAPSLARRLDHHIEPPAFEAPDEPTEPEIEPAAEPAAERADWTTAEPEQLGLVQLVQRLGSSIERRRAWLAESGTAPAAALRGVPDEFEAAPPEEAAQAMANYFGRAETLPGSLAPELGEEPEMASPAPRPHLLRSPLVLDEDEHGADPLPDFSLPLRRPISFDEQPTAPDEDEPDDDGEAGYSSLLALNNPFAAKESEFVRIDEPEEEPDSGMPAVVFPGHQASFAPAFAAEPPVAAQRHFDPPGQEPAPASRPTADTDAALRAALATLQRMSGAA